MHIRREIFPLYFKVPFSFKHPPGTLFKKEYGETELSIEQLSDKQTKEPEEQLNAKLLPSILFHNGGLPRRKKLGDKKNSQK